MSTQTVLFLGQHAPLLQALRNQCGGKFKVEQSDFPCQDTEDRSISMIVWQHEPIKSDMWPQVLQFKNGLPQVPLVVFTSDFSGSNTRSLLKSGATDVFPLGTSEDEVLACFETYLPGFKMAPPLEVKSGNGKTGLILTTAATGMLAALPGLANVVTPPDQNAVKPFTEQPERLANGIELRFLGFFSMTVNGKRVEFTQQARNLFAYLAYNHPRAFSRDHLARVFWPEKHEYKPESARRSLNVELAAIRKMLHQQAGLNKDTIVFEKNNYRLQFDLPIQSDVLLFKQLCHEIQEARRQGSAVSDEMYNAAIHAYSGDFLENCPEETMNWVEVERQHLSALFEQMAEQYSAQLFGNEDFWRAAAVCNEILTRDPNIEVIHRRLMKCYARLGMYNKMEAQYKLLCHILKSRFQSKPSNETQRVYDELRHNSSEE